MKNVVTFIDANRAKFIIEIGINNGRLSMSGQSGQCQDKIKPANEWQQKLVDIWNEWHLNDMHSGTVEQEAYLNSPEGEAKVKRWVDATGTDSYKARCLVLGDAGLLVVPHPVTGEPYTYGHGWLTRELPEDIEDTIEEIIEGINEEEEVNKDQPVSELTDDELMEYVKDHMDDLPLWATDIDETYIALALAKMFDLSLSELPDIEHERDNEWTVQGTTYLAGDDEAMDYEWDEALQSYLDECVLPDLPKNVQMYFDEERWKDDARIDGRAHSLNRYDGGEDEAEVYGTTYYAYQQ